MTETVAEFTVAEFTACSHSTGSDLPPWTTVRAASEQFTGH